MVSGLIISMKIHDDNVHDDVVKPSENPGSLSSFLISFSTIAETSSRHLWRQPIDGTIFLVILFWNLMLTPQIDPYLRKKLNTKKKGSIECE